MTPIGEQLRQLRTRRGLTLKGLAAQFGWSFGNLAAKERGEIPITIEDLDAYCKTLGTRRDIVIGDQVPHQALTAEQEATLAAVLQVLPAMTDSKARSLRVMLEALRDA